MDIPFLRCFPESGAPFKINSDNKSYISKTGENWALCASSIHGKEITICAFEKKVDAEYARLCLNDSLSKGREKWYARIFKSLSDAWLDVVKKLSSDSVKKLSSEKAKKLSDDENIKNIKSLMKSSELVITDDENPIVITIKYPLVCDAWGTDLLAEYQRKIICLLSLECPNCIKWEGASLEFQEHDSQKPKEL